MVYHRLSMMTRVLRMAPFYGVFIPMIYLWSWLMINGLFILIIDVSELMVIPMIYQFTYPMNDS